MPNAPSPHPSLPTRNRKIVLAARPQGMPRPQDFRLVEEDMPRPADGQLLIRHTHLGLAPAARLRMSDSQDSYAAPLALGDVVYGQAVGEVVESRHPQFKVGDPVVSFSAGWQAYSLSGGDRLFPVDTAIAPATAWLGTMGTSGMTAWFGLLDIGRPQPGETVAVSAATGAVGSVAGQIARIQGSRVVGIAGGPAKCDHARQVLGFDACVDYRSPHFADELRAACPGGIDVYFDNVGGAVRDAVWTLLNNFARVAVCGLISEYNTAFQPGPAWFAILSRRLTVRGFIMSDHLQRRGEFIADMGRWYREGRILVKEDITQGLENTPAAFIGMLEGRNFGKTIVQLAEAPGAAV